jgi:hypothetical protein
VDGRPHGEGNDTISAEGTGHTVMAEPLKDSDHLEMCHGADKVDLSPERAKLMQFSWCGRPNSGKVRLRHVLLV